MYLIDSKPTPDERHACVIWLSRAGFVMGLDKRPVEAEPSPASVVAEVAEKHLCAWLFPPGRRCMSRLEIGEISSLRRGLETWPVMKDVIKYYESIVLATPVFDGRLPGIVTEALTKFGPYDLTGIAVLPVITLADSTGEPGDALLADLREALPGATLVEPLALLGETIEEIEPQLTPALDELVK
ncbi:hypothetical protein [Thermophilibacter provencensis]|uniref:Uncharacterized protein n=1 Tax=Thermophilibacter provencensis TaxID=1852386 RepID=A0ABT7V5A8_9ACTN|nr:hypothetical protein [Thermophilibacter provencensis]MDM8271792.1 hypothetical protein [Thermophilibacter provencensis]